MAFPTSVNSQTTDSVTQSNVEVLGASPATAMASLMQAAAHSSGIAAVNAVQAQQNLTTISHAVTTASVEMLLGATGYDDMAHISSLLSTVDENSKK